MSKIVINGVDGNFGSLVAQYALELMNKEDLVFTAPKEESLKEYEKQGIKTAIANFNDPEISIATRIAYGYTSANTAELAASVYKYYFHLEDTSTLLDGQAEDVGAAANAFND